MTEDEKKLEDSVEEEQEMEVIPEEEAEITLLEEKNEQLEDQILRLHAEIANIKRINTKDRQNAAKYRSQDLATELLDAMDNLERALAVTPETEEGKSLYKGVEMVYEQFIRAFENEKITQIDPMNEEFDPNFHQAVQMLPAEEGQKSHSVIHVLQKGYLLDDRVIRPAMVIVAE